MKRSFFSWTLKNSALLGACFCFGVPRLVSAQIIDPIGPYDPIIGPEVRIISPANHAVFFTPVNISIFAFVVRPAETTNVEFYAGTNDLGPGFSLGATARPPITAFPLVASPIARLGAVYCLVWSNAPVGSYALKAVARGPFSLSRTSPSVNITITVSTTVTNRPDVVSIVATDPIAIVGTNKWFWPGLTNATPAWTNWPPLHWQWFTNWGPKDALFTVRRFGDATDPLTTTYHIGGTASNGVDYAALPGSVTIPAGKAYALIPIVPIDNGPPHTPKTVVLTLTPATNVPPDYLVGVPSRATALILGAWPRPLPFLLPDASFHVNASGPDGTWFRVENSSDLLNWSAVCTNQVFQGSIDFVDPDTQGNPVRYYRAVPLAGPPPQ